MVIKRLSFFPLKHNQDFNLFIFRFVNKKKDYHIKGFVIKTGFEFENLVDFLISRSVG